MSKTKNVTVKVRMTAEEKKKLKRFARSQHATISRIVRDGVDVLMEACR